LEFGVSVGHISAVDFAQHGERLGFTRCWVTDSPLIRSNLFATLAAVALKTSTIQIGAGVAVCGMRLAPEAANGVATINALAPGRNFAIFGSGNTAMRMLGLRPTGARELREYVRVVRALLRGEEVAYSPCRAHPKKTGPRAGFPSGDTRLSGGGLGGRLLRLLLVLCLFSFLALRPVH
jgi:alkanesulfonate monooxygenase SsuD/methylene tetrahydromethanopterin reductase-like flavin-dependent oxidoreductase (luciferase family)